MEPTDTEAPEVTEPATISDFTSQIESLLEKLVPPDEVELRLVDGRSVMLPGAIPARRQIKVFRLMRELLEMERVQGLLQAESSAAGIVNVLVELTTDLDVAIKLAQIFKEAYPEVLDEGQDPLDALALEDLVTAVVPFTERFVKKLGKGILVLTKVAS